VRTLLSNILKGGWDKTADSCRNCWEFLYPGQLERRTSEHGDSEAREDQACDVVHERRSFHRYWKREPT
jgi:hypothetical protein